MFYHVDDDIFSFQVRCDLRPVGRFLEDSPVSGRRPGNDFSGAGMSCLLVTLSGTSSSAEEEEKAGKRPNQMHKLRSDD